MIDDDETEMRRRAARSSSRDKKRALRLERLRGLWATERLTWASRLVGCEADTEDDGWWLSGESEWTMREMCAAAMALDRDALHGFLDGISSSGAIAIWAEIAKHHGLTEQRESALYNCLYLQKGAAAEAAQMSLARLLDELLAGRPTARAPSVRHSDEKGDV